MPKYKICRGDMLEELDYVPDNYFDAIVTDPPYGLKFMGKRWDYDVPTVEQWAECLRVLKPGGHLLCFAGTRTQHRMATRIEDAGFEIRDMLAWVYGSGFPKSLDVSKAIDKEAGAVRTQRLAPKAGHENFVGRDNLKGLRDGTIGQGEGGSARPWMNDPQKVEDSHWEFAPATAAAAWEGWGTALKPALEPITLARKPLIGTVADNVLTHGTGALNIDRCRVEGGTRPLREARRNEESDKNRAAYGEGLAGSKAVGNTDAGRWPANLIHDGSDEVLDAFPDAPGQLANASATAPSPKTSNVYGRMNREGEPSANNNNNNGAVGFKMKPGMRRLDAGSSARFFYCAKASKSERGNDNRHPTVKPVALMRYLCRLITPPGGKLLDPYMGSGTTGVAAMLEGFEFVGFDRDDEGHNCIMVAKRRIGEALTLRLLDDEL